MTASTMTYHWIVPLVAAILNAIVGAIVWRHDHRKPLNRSFSLLSAAVVCWNLNIFVLYLFHDKEEALYWSSVFRVGTLLTGAAMAHLMVLLNGTRSRLIWGLLLFSYAVTVLLIGANAGGYLVHELKSYPWGFYPVGTPLYEMVPVLLAYNTCLSLGLLIHTARTNKSPRERQQARLWIVGMAIAVPFSMMNLLATLGIPVYPLGNLASAVYAGFIAYSIVRYRLMDIDIVVTKGVAYSLVTLVVIAPAGALAVWLESIAFGRVSIDFTVALFALFFVVATIFPVLRSRTENRLEKSLFPRRYEHRTELAAFTRSIVRILDRDELVTRVAETLESALSVDRLAIAVLDDSRRLLAVHHSSGIPPAIAEFPLAHAFVEVLCNRNDAILVEELEASHDRVEQTMASDVCRANGWEVLLPLISGRKILGFIALGRKRSMFTYYATEIELLATLAAEAAVALDNARLHEELTRSQEIIRRADRLSALGTLAAGIAHEIRNPLVSIQTFFQLAPQRLGDPEFLTEFLRLTSSEVKRITDLISDLLSFARSPSPSMTEVDVNELIDGVARLLEPQLRKEQVIIEKELDPTLRAVRADRDQLKQVFLNLILNAAQAIESKGTIRISSREVAHKGEPYCQIEIADSGAGIPQELIDDIFNPFFTTKDKGTGLGLAITNQVISEHAGFIHVESEVGKGTKFQIHLHPASAKLLVDRSAAGARNLDAHVDEEARRVGGVKRQYG